jgi:CheY-like chemotaxis protein
MGEPLRVVLVEDDEPLQQQLSGALARALPDVEVTHTPDADDGLRLVCDQRSRLLITEAQSEAVDGLTLAACARKQRPTLPVIFLGSATERSAEKLMGFGGAHRVEKPPHLGRFVGLVARCLDSPMGFRGELASHDLIELVQLVLMTTSSGALHVSAPEGRGTLWLEQGSIVHAESGEERGTAAFQHMLRWAGGGFSVDPSATPPARTITFNTTQLLLESTRILDEESSRALVFPSASERRREERAAEHFERGLEAVHEKRYQDAFTEWELAMASEPDNRVYQHNLRRLRAMMTLGR